VYLTKGRSIDFVEEYSRQWVARIKQEVDALSAWVMTFRSEFKGFMGQRA